MSDTLHGEKPRACTNCSRAKARCVWRDNDDDVCQRLCPSHAKILEQKLDDIMGLLTGDGKRLPDSEQRPPFHQTEGATPTTTPQIHPAALSSENPESIAPPHGLISVFPGFEITRHEADQSLEEYMTTMLPEFPFVPLPSSNLSQALEEKPLLTKTILCVSIGLVEDLKLTRPQKSTDLSFKSIVEDAAHLRDDLPVQPKQTRADRRTLLGVYYITSSLCSLLGKRCKPEYTAHFDDCCSQLLHDQEYPTDALLVQLVRIQKIAMKVNDAFWETTAATNDRPLGGIYSIAVASIQTELDAFVDQLPANLKWNHLLQTHCATVRIRLFEPFRYGDQTEIIEPTHLRCRRIWDCLQSTQALHDEFRLVPVESYPALTFVTVLHLALAIIKALRLLCVEDQAWDLTTARATYDLPGMLRELSKRFEVASRGGSPRSRILLQGRPIFSAYAEAYRGIERGYSTKLNGGVVPPGPALVDPVNAYGGEQCDMDFWAQLSELTNGLVP
ncbi:fungal specific transcription factor domain-containing protein [Aspergillus aculeatinus CBS 121060]|uniref:Uncharacterized protein n=1 Tax=Aspergillus aculeatinus CBS 121060 TaxID=1448322 RepID=A0ACD1HD08_9EURO|nr:hypothetical protein BO66DRAFT_448455 [Aspergillus aculeatinus CBS 121060]RAH71276.1 hypothetical protein BO66DRAFT_448455 [Aspergillus aculeatinus CBS 121060]